MMRFRIAFLLCATLACGRRDAASGGPGVVAIGSPAPTYASTTVDGTPITLASERGKVVLLNIWATWCHPCRLEIPVLEELHQRYSARGFEVVGVSVDAAGEQAKIKAFAGDMKMTYPLWHDPDERVSQTFLAVGVPATYLIDKQGTLRWRKVGPISEKDTTLVKEIENALR